jgi:dynein heavy chain
MGFTINLPYTKVGLPLSWNTIQYMVAEVQYGGRITDDFDRELFITYAAKWLNDSMRLGCFGYLGSGMENPRK